MRRASRQFVAILLRGLVVHAVHLQRGGRFLREIEQFRPRHLHPERELVRRDTGGDLHVAGFGQTLLVQIAHRIERGPSAGLASRRQDCSGTESGRRSCGAAYPDRSTAEIRWRSWTRRRWFPRPSPTPRKPGRFCDSLPSPYTTQAPIVGRPNCIEPVNSSNWPGW